MQVEGQNTSLNFILQLPATLCSVVFLATLWAAPLSCCISIELENTNANFMHHLMVFHAPVRLKGGGGRGGFVLCVCLSVSLSLVLSRLLARFLKFVILIVHVFRFRFPPSRPPLYLPLPAHFLYT